jgi:hypothetical protein
LVEKGLQLMQQVHLIEVVETDKGIEFGASEDAPSYLDLLQAQYSVALKERARWIAGRFAGLTTNEMRTLIESRIGRWTADFRLEEPTGRSES